MVFKIIDYFKLDSDHKKALAALLSKDSNATEWKAGTYSDVKLYHTIIKHESSAKYGKLNNERRFRFEVLDTSLFSDGGFALIYKSICTLSIDESGTLHVKQRRDEGKRLIKFQPFNPRYKESSSVELARMVRESQYMQQNSFFHVKPITSVSKGSYITMRELQTDPLDKWINADKFSVSERLQLSIDLLRALQSQIHDKGLIHYDIKPENIIVKRNERGFEIFIIDYGWLGTEKEVNIEHPYVKGTPFYSAPECYSFDTTKSKEIDIYSMGRTLMGLWGHRFSLKKLPLSFEIESCKPNYNGLFKYMRSKPTHQEELTALFKKMCDPDPLKRCTIKEAIAALEELHDIKEANNVLNESHDIKEKVIRLTSN